MDVRTMHFQKLIESRSHDSGLDGMLFLMCFLGIELATRINEDIMQMKKDFEIAGYKFTIGIHNSTNYTVGLLSWPGLRSFHPDELRKYRYMMFKAQVEITKMQGDVDRVLRDSALG